MTNAKQNKEHAMLINLLGGSAVYDKIDECAVIIREDRCEELKQFLTGFEYQNKKQRQLLFQCILERAMECRNDEAIRIILSFMEAVYPVSFEKRELITEDADLFRMLIQSNKLMCFPDTSMVVKNTLEKGIYKNNLFDVDEEFIKGNLMQICILRNKIEFVKIMLEEGYPYSMPLRENKEDNLGEWKELSQLVNSVYYAWLREDDAVLGYFPLERKSFSPLWISFRLRRKEITMLLMEEEKKEPYIKEFTWKMLEYMPDGLGEKATREFYLWFLEEFKDYVLERLDMEWLICNGGLYEGLRETVLRIYYQGIGLKPALREFRKYIEDSLEGYSLFTKLFPDSSLESLILHLETLDKMIQTEEEKEEMFQFKKWCFESLREHEKACRSMSVFCFITEFLLGIEKCLDSGTVNRLIEFYLTTEENISEFETQFYFDSCLTMGEVEKMKTRSLAIMDKLMKRPEIVNGSPKINLCREKVDGKRLKILMNILQPENNREIDRVFDRTIDIDEGRETFLAAVLHKNSISLVKIAWKRNYLTRENLPEAITYAKKYGKDEILPYLFQFQKAAKAEDEEITDSYVL